MLLNILWKIDTFYSGFFGEQKILKNSMYLIVFTITFDHLKHPLWNKNIYFKKEKNRTDHILLNSFWMLTTDSLKPPEEIFGSKIIPSLVFKTAIWTAIYQVQHWNAWPYSKYANLWDWRKKIKYLAYQLIIS